MLRMNLMQLQVVFQEVYETLYSGMNQYDNRTAQLIESLEKNDTVENWNRLKEIRGKMVKERANAIKLVESLSKTIKQVSAEYRQGEMAKAQFYHVSEVKALQMFVLAILKQQINDQTMLNNISEALEMGFRQMGSMTKPDEASNEEI